MKKTCGWLIEVAGGEKLACGAEATGTVTMRDRIGAGKVNVCHRHKAEHNQRAAELRATSNSNSK